MVVYGGGPVENLKPKWLWFFKEVFSFRGFIYTLRRKKRCTKKKLSECELVELMYMYGKTNDYNLRKIGWFIEVIDRVATQIFPCQF